MCESCAQSATTWCEHLQQPYRTIGVADEVAVIAQRFGQTSSWE